jgi:hypothetical protein
MGHLILALVYWRRSWRANIFETLLFAGLLGPKNPFLGMRKNLFLKSNKKVYLVC